MDHVEASRAKQNFGELLQRAAREPVGLLRHRKLVAAVVPPDWLARAAVLDERSAARERQRVVELQRLANHQRIAIELLCGTERQRAKILLAAHREVDRWEAQQLCSRDYIKRWRDWLRQPVEKLVRTMCSDVDGWGPAMRQNSPFLSSPESP